MSTETLVQKIRDKAAGYVGSQASPAEWKKRQAEQPARIKRLSRGSDEPAK